MPLARPSASVRIAAPIATVWAVVLDTAAYGEWNPFVVAAETASPVAPGNPIVLHVRFRGGIPATSPERIVTLDHPSGPPGARTACLSYVSEGLPARAGLVKTLRHQRLTETAEGTRYDTWIEMRGPAAWITMPLIRDGFRRQAQALKVRAEATA